MTQHFLFLFLTLVTVSVCKFDPFLLLLRGPSNFFFALFAKVLTFCAYLFFCCCCYISYRFLKRFQSLKSYQFFFLCAFRPDGSTNQGRSFFPLCSYLTLISSFVFVLNIYVLLNGPYNKSLLDFFLNYFQFINY